MKPCYFCDSTGFPYNGDLQKESDIFLQTATNRVAVCRSGQDPAKPWNWTILNQPEDTQVHSILATQKLVVQLWLLINDFDRHFHMTLKGQS